MTVNLFVIKGIFHTEDIIDKAYKSFYEGAPPKVLRENKKPFFENSPLFFSVSHSKEYTTVAFFNEEIGIDLQDRRNCKEKSIVKKFFHPDEQKAYLNGYDFFKIWTAKESYVKQKGTGIDKDFKNFSIFDINHFTYLDIIPDHTLCIYTEQPVNIQLKM